jgi:hypothetical protein
MLTDEELAHYHSEGYVVRRGAFDCAALVERLAPAIDERPRETVEDFHSLLLAQPQPHPVDPYVHVSALCGVSSTAVTPRSHSKMIPVG